MSEVEQENAGTIAIVGMHIRVPGADSLDSYWKNLKDGICSITFFDDDELLKAGMAPEMVEDPNLVKANGFLDGIDKFDADFFDMTPKEVEILDPQHRLMMEGVWKGLEHAAIDPYGFPGRIGLYGGVGFNGYLVHHILNAPSLMHSAGEWQLSLSNDKDFATTRIAYKFNLQGPAISVNTACSTSLVATTLAAQSLLNHQTDVAIASGCSIQLPQNQGYIYTKGGTLSPDGYCRPFDTKAAGTIDGNGTASVVLKRYEDAIAQGDTIYGVIRGFAVNNDGNVKVGYTAPSVEGQADVILEALEMANLEPGDISFIETHGTGTDLGDQVEITALAEVFSSNSTLCHIGSVKSNIGHLDTAAGLAGLIKVVLSMQNEVIPPTCHFTAPNPNLNLEATPFKVNAHAISWEKKSKVPRRAGVSSFGIGGTNVHLVVEEYKAPEQSKNEPHWLVLPFSAKTIPALLSSIENVLEFLQHHEEHAISDVAYTLQTGRSVFDLQAVWVLPANDRTSLIQELESNIQALKEIVSYQSGQANQPKNTTSDRDLILTHSLECIAAAEEGGVPIEFTNAAKYWLGGTDPEWDGFMQGCKRIALPGYPLKYDSFWVSGEKKELDSTDSVTKIEQIDRWFYLPSWKNSLPPMQQPMETSNWLIIGGNSECTAKMALFLKEKGHEVRIVHDLTSPFELDEQSPYAREMKASGFPVHHLDSTLSSAWTSFFKENPSYAPNHVIHTTLFGVSASDEQLMSLAFDGLCSLGYSLGHTFMSEDISVHLLSDGIFSFAPNESLRPEKTTALGPLKVMAQEYPNIHTCAIDVETNFRLPLLMNELMSPIKHTHLVYRGGERWIETFEAVDAKSVQENRELMGNSIGSRIVENGCYVITGGLGEIGLTLATHLAKRNKLHFTLIGRSTFPDQQEWDTLISHSSTSQRLKNQIKQIKEIQDGGSTVELRSADVSDSMAMSQIFDEIEKKYKQLNGIIHAAGIVGEDSFVSLDEGVSEQGYQKNKAQFPSKVDGTATLATILAHRSFDFCLVCSSLSPILGGLGFSAYAATNLYADALVSKLNKNEPGKWITVNWEGWIFDDGDVPGDQVHSSALELGMTPEEGCLVFDRIMSVLPSDRIVVSSGDLTRRLEQWVNKSDQGQSAVDTPTHDRPMHIGAYAAPKTSVEKELVIMWGHLLGIKDIGIEDSFFELGGNSLLLTQMVALIRKSFKVELALSALFEHPNIHQIASGIEEALNKTVASEDREEGVI